MVRGKTTGGWLLALLLIIGSGAASHADAIADRTSARAHFRRGMAFYVLNHYQKALAEFEAGYAAEPQPAFLYNLGQVHVKLGHPKEALDFYRKYLEMAPPPIEDEGSIRAIIAQLERGERPPPIPAPPPPEAPPSEPTPSLAVPSPILAPAAAPAPTPIATESTPLVVATPKPRRVLPIAVGVAAAVVFVGITLGVGLGLGLQRDTTPSLLWSAR